MTTSAAAKLSGIGLEGVEVYIAMLEDRHDFHRVGALRAKIRMGGERSDAEQQELDGLPDQRSETPSGNAE